MTWSLLLPPRHPLAKKRRVTLADLVDQPLILFERSSTGRQHVVDAFHLQGLSPRVEVETTTTEIVVRMVEAGTGNFHRAALAQRYRDARPPRRGAFRWEIKSGRSTPAFSFAAVKNSASRRSSLSIT